MQLFIRVAGESLDAALVVELCVAVISELAVDVVLFLGIAV